MRLRCVTFLILVGLVLAEPYGKGGGRGGGGRGGGGRGGGGRGSTSHTYPSSNGYSGNSASKSHTYPQSTGLSGSGHSQQTTYQHHQTNTHNYAKTEVHHHYHYSPPQQISYGSTYHPVYRLPPPVYVYQYRDSGSRFDNLLTGLALYNLGRMSARQSHYDVNREYRHNPGEICKLGISRRNGEYEETRVDCRLMTSFIWESGSQSQNTQQQVASVNKTTTTVVSSTSISNDTRTSGLANESKVTTTTTVVDAVQVKGPSIPITSDMKCFMIHISRDTSIMKKNVDCALLQMYAQQSLYRNSSARIFPTFFITLFTYLYFYLF